MDRKGIIKIKSVQLEKEAEKVELTYNISVGDNNGNIYYRLDKKYETALAPELSDGMIVTLLPYALRGGYDIVTDIPMSQKLYYGLAKQLIPQLEACNHNCYKTQISAPLEKLYFSPQGVGTAMSCGVDSFTTLKEYTIDCNIQDFKITHLTFYENGAHHLDKIGFASGQKELFLNQSKAAREFSDEYGYDFILIESNLNEILSQLFWDDMYELTHTYRNIGFSLLLQKLFRGYYYASTYNFDNFELDLNADPAHYERFLLSCCSTENTDFYVANEKMTRLEKTRYISDFEQTYDHLLVCYMSGRNCGNCKKCRRTLLTLDVLEKTELYANSFDLKKYEKDRNIIFADMIMNKEGDAFLSEIFHFIKECGLSIPVAAYPLALKKMAKQYIAKTRAFRYLYPIYRSLAK